MNQQEITIHTHDELSAYRKLAKSLTPREREVMGLLLDAMTLKEIAEILRISVQTASKHRLRLLDKLGAKNEVALVKMVCNLQAHRFHATNKVAS